MSSSRLVSAGAGPYRSVTLRVPVAASARRVLFALVACLAVAATATARWLERSLRTPAVAATSRFVLRPRARVVRRPEPPPVPLADVTQLSRGAGGSWYALTRDGSVYQWPVYASPADLAVATRSRAHRKPTWAPVTLLRSGTVACMHPGDPVDYFLAGGILQGFSTREEPAFDAASIPAIRADHEAVADFDTNGLLSITRTVAGLVRVTSECEPGEYYYSHLATPAPAPEPMPDAAQVAVGSTLACARTARGEVRCWAFFRGDPPDGVDDARDVVDRRAGPLRVPVPAVSSLVLDGDRGCGVARDGGVWCWQAEPRPPLRWRTWQHPWLRDAARLHTLAGSLCATLVDDRVVCDRRWTQHSDAPSQPPARTEHPGLRGALQIVADYTFNAGYARFADGTVRAWGAGELPDGRLRASPTPVRADVPDALVTLGAGARHACGLARDGRVWCWGALDAEQSGDARVHRPALVDGLTGVTQVAVGARHTCALLGDGSVACWGSNAMGECGVDRATAVVTTPHRLTELAGVAEISAGSEHTCARMIDGAVRCWGAFGRAWPGHPRVRGAVRPLDVALPEGAVGLVSAGGEACALLRSGSYRCWGGEGTPDVSGESEPRETVEARFGDPTARIVPSATAGTDCVHTFRGELSCGLCFDDCGTTGPRAGSPYADDAVAVARNAWTLCAARAGGAVSCWHRAVGRDEGEPVPEVAGVQLARPARSVAMGDAFACALDVDGAAWCWGANDVGQLGAGAPGVVEIDAPALVVR